MIFLIHENSCRVVEVYRNSERIHFSANICDTTWKLAEQFPDEILVWIEKDLYPYLRKESLDECLDYDLVMSSYAVKKKFLAGEIGYVDQLPFINVKSEVKYPTWRMSSDVGGIKTKTILEFRDIFKNISNFEYLLNSISKLGQQNGLFCYSDPQLIDKLQETEIKSTAGNKELFSFIFQHYNSIWVFVLFFCIVKYEKRFPVLALLQSLLKPKFFKKNIDGLGGQIINRKSDNFKYSVDVIIPTIGRPEYVKQVIEDLNLQRYLPKRVIIVEQEAEKNLKSELQDFLSKDWPFKIVHIFTHKTGACMARNEALEEVKSDWIFFADDDIRIEKNIIADTLMQASLLRADCINLNCKQIGEDSIFKKVKQWGSFGSGTSMVKSRFAKDLRFSEVFEHGYGEDSDFGMKLRRKGCDIIYHPELEIQHLKAPVGGFRKKPVMPWEMEDPKPKPSPTVMIFAKRYYTQRQIKGFKISLYLKYFRNQKNKNPFSYLRNMERDWKKSEEWAAKLEFDAGNSWDNKAR